MNILFGLLFFYFSLKQNQSSSFADIDEDVRDYSHDDQNNEYNEDDKNPIFSKQESQEFDIAEDNWDVMNDPARRATIESAGEDLKNEFEELSNKLREVIAQRDEFKLQINEMKDMISLQKTEKKDLLKQVWILLLS